MLYCGQTHIGVVSFCRVFKPTRLPVSFGKSQWLQMCSSDNRALYNDVNEHF